jgi:2-amino-1-hydroxyethylphosphonate dioxygenase (glycine-forming)
MLNHTIIQSADEIMFLYEQHGSEDYIGEPVSQIEHMCQCAQLAEAAGANHDIILAAFLHDIGHLYEAAFPEKKVLRMDSVGIFNHENLGATYLLSKGFSEKIAKLVQSHVAAKRYLTCRYPEYYDRLSDASKKTLEFQGGRMTPEEALDFESDILFEDYVALRRWDDEAKKTGQALPDLLYYRQLITEHLAQQDN